MKKIKYLLLGLFVGGLMTASLSVTPMFAAGEYNACKDDANNSIICQNQDEGKASGSGTLSERAKGIINTALMVVGILSVIVMIVAGIFYLISTGDKDKIKRAKNTLMYAIVGLVISILSFAIVNYVVDNIQK